MYYYFKLTEKKEIKKAKEKYKLKWFDEISLTCVNIQIFEKKIIRIDISDLVLELKKLSTTIDSFIYF